MCIHYVFLPPSVPSVCTLTILNTPMYIYSPVVLEYAYHQYYNINESNSPIEASLCYKWELRGPHKQDRTVNKNAQYHAKIQSYQHGLEHSKLMNFLVPLEENLYMKYNCF